MRQPSHLLAGAQRVARGLRAQLTRSARGRPRPLPGLRRVLRILGPGLVTGAADDDPSGIGTYSQAGAAFGVGQLWLALYMLPMLIAVQEMCARIGLVTGRGIAANLRAHYSRPILYFTVALVFAANTLNIGADLGAMTATIQLFAPDAPFLPLLVALALAILALEIFVPYHRYAIVLKVLALSLLAYVATGLIVGTKGALPLRATLIPSIQLTPEFLALVVGILGTTISPYLFFWQASEEVEEVEAHHRKPRGIDPARERSSLLKQLRALRVDTVFGLTAAATTFWFIVMTSGNTLHTHGITNIQSADQAALALRPLAGPFAQQLFALGIVGTGLLAVPVLAGSAAYGIAEAVGWHEGLAKTLNHARGFYGVIALATLVGLALNLLGVNPIAALVDTAIINGVVAVPLLVL
ncbi:MAG: divalent metal cation transporter, partial [Chloroflexota bacterium]|nr:divalent metal cation transporter [Chloroflexota bacterium]